MIEWIDQLKDGIPDYAKDIKLNLDAVVKRSSLELAEVYGITLASAFATGNTKLWTWIHAQAQDEGIIKERDAALTAASLMAMNNVWYPYVEMAEDPELSGLPAQLRMNAIISHGGTTKARFEVYSLAASIVGKCKHCVAAHYATLKSEGYSTTQLRDIGRIAATIAAAGKIMVG